MIPDCDSKADVLSESTIYILIKTSFLYSLAVSDLSVGRVEILSFLFLVVQLFSIDESSLFGPFSYPSCISQFYPLSPLKRKGFKDSFTRVTCVKLFREM